MEPLDEEQQREFMVKAFTEYAMREMVFVEPAEGVRYRCPCCRYKTLESRGDYEICPVCFWEDDGQDDADADVYQAFSPNHMSVTQGRQNYQWFASGCEQMLQFVW